MSERIKELAVRANCTIDGLGYGEGNLEKFAELIVKECTDYLRYAVEVHDQQDQFVCELAARKLEEHFGVEE